MTSDVAIVGAGPAGAWTAYRLAAAGARVTILDASHPREKPCGGGVTGRALDLVRSAVQIDGVPRLDIGTARFESDRVATPVGVRLPRQSLSIYSRAAFDRALLEAARDRGAEYVAERVTQVDAAPDRVEVRTRRGVHRAGFLVGADGAASLVRRRLSRPLTKAQISVGAGFFAHGVTSNEIIIRMVTDPPGYIWSFPRRDHLAIGICAQADSVPSVEALKQHTRTWIDRSGVARGATLEAYSWPIPSLASRDLSRDAIAGDRWLLAGDAAGLVDPITREGIFFALTSANLAADTLLAGETGLAYAARVARVIHPELRRAASLKAGFFRPRFTDLLMHALAESDRIRAVMADLIAGRQPYHGLRRRLLGTCEFGLAFRLLRLETIG